MKRWLRAQTKSTVQLTFSYLAIMAAVSIAFSIVLYVVTARELVLQLRQPDGTKQTVINDPVRTVKDPAGDVIGRQSKKNLSRNLILLNTSVVVIGLPFCYFLARRTLRPIEESMDRQIRFSSDAAHELRTPVAALRVRNEVALRDTKLTLKQAKQVIKDSVEQSIRLEKLSEALLQLSKDDVRNPLRSAVHLEDVANEAMNINMPKAQAKGITITDDVDNIIIFANQQDILQIINILLDNAIKYSPEGSNIIIKSHKDHASAYIYVEDQGQGIRASDIPYIFERFYRADHARRATDEHSYGLGLSIARKLATQNDAKLSVESALDQGSTFTLTLPVTAR